MFICCKKNLHIREGDETLDLKRDFIGSIDDRWKDHWYIQAALRDGSISTGEPEEDSKPKPKKI